MKNDEEKSKEKSADDHHSSGAGAEKMSVSVMRQWTRGHVSSLVGYSALRKCDGDISGLPAYHYSLTHMCFAK
jgi:hypothetical protein